MNYSISYKSALQLKSFIDFFKPSLGYSEFARDIRDGIKYTKFISQRDFLEKILLKGEATPEVITLARRRYLTSPGNE